MTQARWYLAKYVEDLARREPVNIGVILLTENGVSVRFIGQRPDGGVDGRKAKHVHSLDAYRGWIKHWTDMATSRDLPSLLSSRPDDNYLIEPGGERIFGSVPDDDGLIDYLFSTLVDEDDEQVQQSVADMSRSLLRRIGVINKVEEPYVVKLPASDFMPPDIVTFNYRFDNGQPHLMKTANLSQRSDRAWKDAHDLAWGVDRARSVFKGSDKEPNFIALVRPGPDMAQADEQMKFIEHLCTVVDMTHSDEAAADLRELLHLGVG